PAVATSAAVLDLYQAGDRLHPSKGPFHRFAACLADCVSDVPRGARVDRTRPTLVDVLRHVRRDALATKSIDEVVGVIRLVGTERRLPRARDVRHQVNRCDALAVAVGMRDLRTD